MRGWMVKSMNRGNSSRLKKVHPIRNKYTFIAHFTIYLHSFKFKRKRKKLPFPHTEVQSPCTPPVQKIDSTPSLVWLAGQMFSSLALGQHFLLALLLNSVVVVDVVALGDLHQTGPREAGISSSLWALATASLQQVIKSPALNAEQRNPGLRCLWPPPLSFWFYCGNANAGINPSDDKVFAALNSI